MTSKRTEKVRLLRRGIGCFFYGRVGFGERTIIGDYVVIGYPKESRLEKLQQTGTSETSLISSTFNAVKPTTVGAHCRIASHVVIYEGTQIGNNVSIDDFCRVGFDCLIGDNTRLVNAALVLDRVQIEANCIISGILGEGTTIGSHVTSMGFLMHKYTHPHKLWGLIEPAPRVEDRAVIGYGASVIGGVTIGQNSYVAAGAIVTKDVPAKSIVVGMNRVIPHDKWRGKELAYEFWKWGKRHE